MSAVGNPFMKVFTGETSFYSITLCSFNRCERYNVPNSPDLGLLLLSPSALSFSGPLSFSSPFVSLPLFPSAPLPLPYSLSA